MQRLFALKTLNLKPDDDDFDLHSTYFSREIDIHSTLRHPYLVGYIDSFEDAGAKYLLLEYIDGNLYAN